jgi:hypothetical protein
MANAYFNSRKRDRETKLAERRAEKQDRRQERRMRAGSERFPSVFPDAPEHADGVGRTLSRGLEP